MSLAPMKSSTDLETDPPTDAYGLHSDTEQDTKQLLSVCRWYLTVFQLLCVIFLVL
jgi:hypothetical protein